MVNVPVEDLDATRYRPAAQPRRRPPQTHNQLANMADSNDQDVYERIYATELVFMPDCWQLCGDAHCCNFARYKSQFKMLARTPFQELPLFPGEYEFLASRGWLKQFDDHDHKVIEFPIDGYTLKVESIISRKPNCSCDHETRTTICRLYPLLPILDIEGRLIGTEPLGIYEEMERIAGLEPACKLTSLPFDQLNKLLLIAQEIGTHPRLQFYLAAYRIAKRHVTTRLEERFNASGNVFSSFETGFIRRRLTDSKILRAELSELARQFESQFGDRFRSAMCV